jgi:uncharacterized membrane protein
MGANWRALDAWPGFRNIRPARSFFGREGEGPFMSAAMLLFYSLTRFVHVATAVVLVGGTFFMRYVLGPAASGTLSADEHSRLRAGVLSRWKMIVHIGIALFLVSGGINYARVIAEQSHKGDGLYHALLGTKFLLALAIFFIASALVGRSQRFEAMRGQIRLWLGVNLLLATLILGISAFLKTRGKPDQEMPRGGAAVPTSATG